MLFCNSDNDTIFPMDGNNRIAARLRQLYKMYDKPDLFDDYVSKGGHDYRPDLRIAIFKWINKHLKNDTGPVKDADFKPIPGKELRVFPEDSDVPKDAINGKIDETFVPKAKVKLPEPGKFEEWKKVMLKELREKSFRTFPDRIPAAVSHPGPPISYYETQPNIEISGLGGIGGEDNDISRMTYLVLPEIRTELALQMNREYKKDSFVVAIHVRGGPGGRRPWTEKSPPNYVPRSHALLGWTVDQGRVWDIAAVARRSETEHKQVHRRFVGCGIMGIIAAYAALFEPAITEVVIVDPPKSHMEGPIFLNIMRVLDIPEALGLLAPRPLTLINAKDKAFDRTAEIYKLAGAEKNFHRK
jgi:hypothetical protein